MTALPPGGFGSGVPSKEFHIPKVAVWLIPGLVAFVAGWIWLENRKYVVSHADHAPFIAIVFAFLISGLFWSLQKVFEPGQDEEYDLGLGMFWGIYFAILLVIMVARLMTTMDLSQTLIWTIVGSAVVYYVWSEIIHRLFGPSPK